MELINVSLTQDTKFLQEELPKKLDELIDEIFKTTTPKNKIHNEQVNDYLKFKLIFVDNHSELLNETQVLSNNDGEEEKSIDRSYSPRLPHGNLDDLKEPDNVSKIELEFFRNIGMTVSTMNEKDSPPLRILI